MSDPTDNNHQDPINVETDPNKPNEHKIHITPKPINAGGPHVVEGKTEEKPPQTIVHGPNKTVDKTTPTNPTKAPFPAIKPTTPVKAVASPAASPVASKSVEKGPNQPHPHPAPGHSDSSGQAGAHQARIAAQHKMVIHDLSKDHSQVYSFLLECSCGYQARSHSKQQAEIDQKNHSIVKTARASVG